MDTCRSWPSLAARELAMGLALLSLPWLLHCGGPSDPGDRSGKINQTLKITPTQGVLTKGATLAFAASVPWAGGVTWAVLPESGGTFDGQGIFTAKGAPGSYRVIATFNGDVRYTGTVPLTILPVPEADITADPFVPAQANGLRASVPNQPNCTYAWSSTGATFTSPTDGAQVTYTSGGEGTLTLTCKVTNAAGNTATRTFTVNVEAPPTILSFTALPVAIQSGGTTRLLASFRGDAATLSPTGLTMENGIPLPVVLQQTTTFTLTVQNRSGQQVSTPLTITVGDLQPPLDPTPGQIWTDPALGLPFVYIPSGTFTMGASLGDPNTTPSETPLRSVTFNRGFWLSQQKVSQEVWQKLMAANPSFFLDRDLCSHVGTALQRPVEMVSWADAQAFLSALNARQETYLYRLPSEAEWEYAYRAGSTSRFFWGDDLGLQRGPEYGWIKTNGALSTHPLGTLKPNPWNLSDIVGNVMEWVADVYLPDLSQVPSDGSPVLGNRTATRAVRGSAWNDSQLFARASSRHAAPYHLPQRTLGFRIARPHRDAPQILAFKAEPSQLPKGGGKTTLRWNAPAGTTLWIEGLGNVTGSASREVDLSQTTTFLLYSRSETGWTCASATVEVAR